MNRQFNWKRNPQTYKCPINIFRFILVIKEIQNKKVKCMCLWHWLFFFYENSSCLGRTWRMCTSAAGGNIKRHSPSGKEWGAGEVVMKALKSFIGPRNSTSRHLSTGNKDGCRQVQLQNVPGGSRGWSGWASVWEPGCLWQVPLWASVSSSVKRKVS